MFVSYRNQSTTNSFATATFPKNIIQLLAALAYLWHHSYIFDSECWCPSRIGFLTVELEFCVQRIDSYWKTEIVHINQGIPGHCFDNSRMTDFYKRPCWPLPDVSTDKWNANKFVVDIHNRSQSSQRLHNSLGCNGRSLYGSDKCTVLRQDKAR